MRRNDYVSTYNDAVGFTSDVQVTDADFVRVQCFASNNNQPVYTNFHALARLKPNVERRCDAALDQGRRLEDVVNVLMVGIDSTSRLNSIRRLNSTRHFLIQQLHVTRPVSFSVMFCTCV